MVQRVAERFRALGDVTRIRILMHLQQGECAVGALAASLQVGQASISKHLERLRACGIVAVRSEGVNRFYAIRDGSVYQLCEVVCGAVQRLADEDHQSLLGGVGAEP